MRRFLIRFVFLLTALFGLSLAPFVYTHVVLPWTEAVAALGTAAAGLLDPDVMAAGKRIISRETGFSVSIEPGCNGLEPMLLLAAAMLAYPAAWRHRLIGFLSGVGFIQAANLARILTLYYLGQWSPLLFEWAHLYVWPALIVLDAVVVFLVWLRLTPPRHGPHAAG